MKELKGYLDPRARKHREPLWNPVKELKDHQVPRCCQGDCVWNPVKELKANRGIITSSGLKPMWNPVKELKEVIKEYVGVLQNFLWWNPVKELKVIDDRNR